MDERISSSLIERWEQEAISQKVSVYEIGNFMRCKERLYLESFRKEEPSKKVFLNDARNRLSEYGNSLLLDELHSLSPEERTCKVARVRLEDLRVKLSKGFVSAEQKQNFICERDSWFQHLKDRMKELRISKETLESFGLDWKSCKSFAYQTI